MHRTRNFINVQQPDSGFVGSPRMGDDGAVAAVTGANSPSLQQGDRRGKVAGPKQQSLQQGCYISISISAYI